MTVAEAEFKQDKWQSACEALGERALANRRANKIKSKILNWILMREQERETGRERQKERGRQGQVGKVAEQTTIEAGKQTELCKELLLPAREHGNTHRHSHRHSHTYTHTRIAARKLI